jgi:uncharacterized membrane protein YpjA
MPPAISAGQKKEFSAFVGDSPTATYVELAAAWTKKQRRRFLGLQSFAMFSLLG